MFYSYKNIKIHYQIIGNGKPIIMLHGLNCDLNLMKCCMENIFKNKNGYKRIYIDLLGMGKSESCHNMLLPIKFLIYCLIL